MPKKSRKAWKALAGSVSSVSDFRKIMEKEVPGFPEAYQEQVEAEERVSEIRRQLAATRKKAGVGQVELAEMIGTTQSGISAIERGKGDLGLTTLFRYLNGLKVDPQKWLASVSGKMPAD